MKDVYTNIDYQFRWAMRDLRNPYAWTAADRQRRVSLAIISPRWNNPATVDSGGLDNHWGQGKAVLTPNCKNIVDFGWFFNTGASNPTGTYSGGNPPFAAQDGCAHPLNDDYNALDEYGAWARVARTAGLHDFSATLSTAASQGWFEPYFRLDETLYGDGKVDNPYWLVNARHVDFPATFSNYVLTHYSWADGINLEFFTVPSWWKNWLNSTYWASLSAGQKTTFIAEFAAGMESAIALIRLSKPNWIILGQQVPHNPADKPFPGKVNGYFREFYPGALGGLTTNALCIADDKAHRLECNTDVIRNNYKSIWQIITPYTGTMTEDNIEKWKQIARDSQSYVAIGDHGGAWQGPPVGNPR